MKKLLFLLIIFVSLVACKQESKKPEPNPELAPSAVQPSNNTQVADAIKPGSKLYVHANSGVVLRKTPSIDGEKIANVPCDGLPLTVLELPDPANRFVAEKIGTFEVAGGWVKVRTETGKEGYMFDGYLSRYPPAIEEPEAEDSNLEWFYRIISPMKGKRDTLALQPGMILGYKQAFEDGALFRYEYYEGGVTHYFYLPESKMTMQEALILFRPLWFRGKTKGDYDAATKTLTINDVEGYATMTIQPQNGQLVLQFSSAD